MTRNFGVLASVLLTLSFVGYACTSGEVVDGPATGSGNTTGQGTAGAGNTVGSAGTTGGGNNAGVGNNQGQGNGPGRGGTTGSGNTVGSAGSTGNTGGVGNTVGSGGVGNTTGRGGTTGTGNTVGSGGAGNTVGTGGVGNTTGTGGNGSSSCPPTFDVSTNGFVQMPAKGGTCWSGYPYTYQDTYGTMVMPAPMAAWTTNTLKMTGTLAAVSGTKYSYAGMGFSIGQTASGTPTLLSPTGSGLTVTFTNGTTGAGGLRAQVTDGTKTWCKDITTSPATIMYSEFKIECYNGATAGAAYAKEPIKGFELNLPGGTAAATINLTLTSITEN